MISTKKKIYILTFSFNYTDNKINAKFQNIVNKYLKKKIYATPLLNLK
ncbi:hypothetical protein, partial [Plasmodium yoelii yoelii]